MNRYDDMLQQEWVSMAISCWKHCYVAEHSTFHTSSNSDSHDCNSTDS